MAANTFSEKEIMYKQIPTNYYFDRGSNRASWRPIFQLRQNCSTSGKKKITRGFETNFGMNCVGKSMLP